MNICRNCTHHINRKDNGHDTWYNWFCGHPELAREEAIDPVTGKKCYWVKNDLGLVHAGGSKHPYCRDINPTGECELYKRGKR